MRIRLLAPLGGHDVGTVLDHDQQAADWLIGAGFAVAVADVDQADDAEQDEPTSPADSAEASHVPQQRPTTPARRTGKRPPR